MRKRPERAGSGALRRLDARRAAPHQRRDGRSRRPRFQVDGLIQFKQWVQTFVAVQRRRPRTILHVRFLTQVPRHVVQDDWGRAWAGEETNATRNNARPMINATFVCRMGSYSSWAPTADELSGITMVQYN